jgi:hypothetical protein
MPLVHLLISSHLVAFCAVWLLVGVVQLLKYEMKIISLPFRNFGGNGSSEECKGSLQSE